MSIIVENLTYTYGRKTPFEKKALDNITLTINDGDFVGILGHTGSGKSTFIQHLNALIRIQSGRIIVGGIDISKKKVDLKKIRQEIGMVFQYPENQLFDETVLKDVSFGPKNLGYSKDKVFELAKNAIEMVGLDFEEYKDREPYDLSGGEKRRVAIAGVIAMGPKILVLDEPTAGLDPQGKIEILNLIKSLKNKSIDTVVVVSHDIDEIVEYANRLIIFNDSKVAYDMDMENLFKHEEELIKMGLDIPETIKIRNRLLEKGIELPFAVTKEKLINNIVDFYNKRRKE